MKKLFLPLYLSMTRRRFTKLFKPIGIRKKSAFLVTVPADLKEFIRVLPFLENLHGIGGITLLLPRACEAFSRYLKPDLFEYIDINEPPRLFTREFSALQIRLRDRTFDILIALEQPASIHLPYLVPVERRIAFFYDRAYPYYNILIKGGLAALNGFFNFGEGNPKRIFHITESENKKIDKKIGKRHPLLFVGGEIHPAWEGDTFILGKDFIPDITLPKIIYVCDAYHGPDNEWCELARLFKKSILP